MARPKKIKTPKELATKWEEFKQYCDNKTAICHEFSASKGTFISVELNKPITYTIEGFCVYIGILRQDFYDIYANNKKFYDIVTRIREECEIDARRKFEQGTIPTQLSGLWMSKYGYSNKQEVSRFADDDVKQDALSQSLEAMAEDLESDD